jgi:glutathione S-transferase
MRLHSVTFSPNCRKVEAFIHQFELDVEIVQVDMKDPITKTDGFKKLNPNGKVPTLVDDNGDGLWESNVILTYLASLHPETDVLPSDVRQRAETEKWLSWQGSHLGPAVGRVFNKNEEIVSDAKEELAKLSLVLDAQLDGKEYVTGKLSVADFALGSYVACMPTEHFDFNGYANISSWLARVCALPGFKATDVQRPG